MPRRSSIKYALGTRAGQAHSALSVTIGGVLAAGSLQAATITVTTLDDGFINGQCTLRSAISAANNNAASYGCTAGSAQEIDRIVFAPGLSGTIQLEPGLPVVNYWDGSQLGIRESVTIEGPPFINGIPAISVRGTGSAPVFHLEPQADQVSLQKLTITGGHSPADLPGRPGHGGGILSYSRVLQLTDITITGNTADHSGGGVWHDPDAEGGVLLASDSVFNANTSGRAMTGLGGGLGVRNSVVSINDCSFVDNQAGDAGFGGNGGALAIGQSTLTGVVDSLFVNNTATYGSGGGIHFSASESQLYMAGNWLSNNLADLRGGGLYLYDQTQTGQNAADLQLLDNEFFQNHSYSGGGGMMVISGPGVLELSGSRLIENQSGSDGGGALLQLDATQLEWSIGAVSNNLADNFGGGLFIRTRNNHLAFDRIGLSHNQAEDGCGGAISIMPFLDLAGPDSVIFNNNVIFNNMASCGGGFDFFLPTTNGTQTLLASNEWSANQANGLGLTNGSGGALYFNGNQDDVLVVSNSTMSGNLAASSGGGLHAQGSASISVKYSTLAGNMAGLGRAIRSGADSCLVRNTVIASNQSSALDGTTACVLQHTLLQTSSDSFYAVGDGVILNQDPLLGPLTDNGNTLWSLTHAPAANSPVIDAGNQSISLPLFDQRGSGFPRVLGAALDMGALESPAAPPDHIFTNRFE